MIKTYTCKGCKKDNAKVSIDQSSNNSKYGILGLVDLYDARLTKDTVVCNKCKEVIYKYEDVRHTPKKTRKKNET